MATRGKKYQFTSTPKTNDILRELLRNDFPIKQRGKRRKALNMDL